MYRHLIHMFISHKDLHRVNTHTDSSQQSQCRSTKKEKKLVNKLYQSACVHCAATHKFKSRTDKHDPSRDIRRNRNLLMVDGAEVPHRSRDVSVKELGVSLSHTDRAPSFVLHKKNSCKTVGEIANWDGGGVANWIYRDGGVLRIEPHDGHSSGT
ncbi:hypothetical protein E2542_SST18931 [Spatholobus suberectus]|nr:hypothetical protein E2542_SST18931 [Spatholobus suberectus]